MNLKETLKPKSTNKSNSSKNAAFYNKEKSLFIAECSICTDSKVRMFAASNTHTPTKILTEMLKLERDKHVLKAVLLNSRIPRKAVAEFVSNNNDERVDWFENDEEIIERFTQ